MSKPPVRAALAADDPRHGTYNAYHYWQCRCEACSEANRSKHREYARHVREAKRNRAFDVLNTAPTTIGVIPGLWVEDALCAQSDPDAFFPENGSNSSTIKAAKKTCQECPVKAECLEFALRTKEPWGLWGGLTTKERKKLIAIRRST